VHHLSNPDLADDAVRSLVTLFGARVPEEERTNASAWRDAIARAKLDAKVRYRNGEPWRPASVVADLRRGEHAREPLARELDELAVRTGFALDVDLARWSTDTTPLVDAALERFARSDLPAGTWTARA
jgi:hypothetical protein